MFTIDYTIDSTGKPVLRIYLQGKLVQEYEVAIVNPTDLYALFMYAYNTSLDPIGPAANTLPY